MWIMALLWWKRPRLAQNILLGFVTLVAGEAVVTAPGQLYMRRIGFESAFVYPLPEWGLYLGLFGGLLALMLVRYALVLRKRATR